MAILEVSLRAIRDHDPCERGWERLLRHRGATGADDVMFPLEEVLESNGLRDALWALRAVDGHDNAMRLYACRCARQALSVLESIHPVDSRPRKAIEATEQFVWGAGSAEHLAEVARDAREAALGCSPDAANAALSIWCAVEAGARACIAAQGAAGAILRDFPKNEFFAQEFRRLCNLEGEYGEVEQ